MGAARSNTDLDRSEWAATNAAPSIPSVEELVAFERIRPLDDQDIAGLQARWRSARENMKTGTRAAGGN